MRWQPRLYATDLQTRLCSANLIASNSVKPKSEQPSRMLSVPFRRGLPLALDPVHAHRAFQRLV